MTSLFRVALRLLLGLVSGFGVYWVSELILLDSGNQTLEMLGALLSPISIFGWLLLSAYVAVCIMLLGHIPQLRAIRRLGPTSTLS